jgi:aryl-phospho-beta-D-glucosidase BglC (GH1 family)
MKTPARLALTIIANAALCLATLSAQQVPGDRLVLLSRGINLNAWFSPWADPATYDTRFRPDEAAFLKKTGFTVCRLPLAPDLLFDPERPAQPKETLRYVDSAVRLLLNSGLAVVFDPIHSSSSNADWESGLYHDPAFLAKVEVYWESLARHFAGFSTDRIFFEVMNEPHLTAKEKVDPAWWQPVQESLVAAIRRGAPKNTIIATGESWGGIEGLLALKPLSDPDIVYSFHWYDPFTFTHQGATWTAPIQAELSGIPYPSSPTSVAQAAAALDDPKARAQVLRYGSEGWDETRVRSGLERAAAWGKANHVPLFCGEFGVYRKVAPQADRLHWISDVRTSLEAVGIGWSMWDYETDFGLVAYSEPQWRRGIQVDHGGLSALGLDASADIAPRPGEVTLADFSSGKVQSIDIPIEAWSKLWTRDAGVGKTAMAEGGETTSPVLKIVHRGLRDWSLGSGLRIPVTAGEELTLSSRAALDGSGSLGLEFAARDTSGTVIDWSYGGVALSAGPLRETIVDVTIAKGIASLEPRWSGSGPITASVEAFRVERRAEAVGEAVSPEPLAPLSLGNAVLTLDFDPGTAAFSVSDLRTKQVWKELPDAGSWTTVSAKVEGHSVEALLVEAHTGHALKVVLTLDPGAPEVEVELDASGPMSGDVRYPRPFVPVPGSRLIVPLNEGISYPVDDPAVPTGRLVAYGGHGICMSFWGADTSAGLGSPGPEYMAIIETPDDASLDLRRTDGLLSAGPVWEAQKSEFGYARKLRYVFFQSGGPVAIAARYRAYVEARGGLVTLAQKREKNPNVDLLMGAADVWYWDKDPAGMAAQLKAAGMDRVLWSAEEAPATVANINALGFLSGRYDIYQDVMDPAHFPRLRYVQKEWPTEAWPADLVRDRKSDWIHGWEVEAKDGTRIPCGVLSDSRALPYAEKRISEDLVSHSYRARFIDTTTASQWREDWDPTHPMTRSESREWRMRLLDLVSNEKKLITGSETGHDAAVPYLHYFEGMMSLAPFRIKDAGRDMQRILDTAPDPILRFQLGWKYRIPLWELVYHDCVVAYWYWGDYSNKITPVWRLRDLFNALYGTPPEYMFDSAFWKSNREQFAASYQAASGTARATAYAAMSDFRILTEDRSVQRSVFSNGVQVTVNFGNSAWTMEDGSTLAPGSFALR